MSRQALSLSPYLSPPLPLAHLSFGSLLSPGCLFQTKMCWSFDLPGSPLQGICWEVNYSPAVSSCGKERLRDVEGAVPLPLPLLPHPPLPHTSRGQVAQEGTAETPFDMTNGVLAASLVPVLFV